MIVEEYIPVTASTLDQVASRMAREAEKNGGKLDAWIEKVITGMWIGTYRGARFVFLGRQEDFDVWQKKNIN